MWIHVRSMDGRESHRIDDLSKLTSFEEVRERCALLFDVDKDRIKLIFSGKMLVDEHSLFDYNVKQNDIVQAMIRPVDASPLPSSPKKPLLGSEDNKENEEPNAGGDAPRTTTQQSDEEPCDVDVDSIYKVGDIVDVRDAEMGAWFEASIKRVRASDKTDVETPVENNNDVEIQGKEPEIKEEDTDANTMKTDDEGEAACPWDAYIVKKDACVYTIVYDGYEEDDPVEVSSIHIRPRAKKKIPQGSLKIGAAVMVNYNYDDPAERGYWYDALVTGVTNKRSAKEVYCTVFIGRDLLPMKECRIHYFTDMFEIEKPGTQGNILEGDVVSSDKRKSKFDCDQCRDDPRKRCKHCACYVCGKKENPGKTLMCDDCDLPYHIYCLTPPLESLPSDDEWYCPQCKTDAGKIVGAGESLKHSAKKAKMASATGTTARDWGKGMATVGTTKQCTIVARNHFGAVPGVPVGAMWKFRVQVSESGIHRPHVAGIAGRSEEGCFSIVLGGGYEDDVDNGDEFTYTGSGGRDLSGNKRTAEQSQDQELTRNNLSIARNCKCKLDTKDGGDAGDSWREGRPVRVVRGWKGAKHSKYAPQDGCRYDGLYKVVKYWAEKGKSGFKVWRYLFRRDDDAAAPWTKKGMKKMEALGLEMQFPDGYLETLAAKKEAEDKDTPKRKKKRKSQAEDSEEEAEPQPEKKKTKIQMYDVDKDVQKEIDADGENKKAWEEVLATRSEGAKVFLEKVEEIFACVVCVDLVYEPVTNPCLHNVCKKCMKRAFASEMYECPMCRHALGEDYPLKPNKHLSCALVKLFPGYEVARGGEK